jgi:hypothetical protein
MESSAALIASSGWPLGASRALPTENEMAGPPPGANRSRSRSLAMPLRREQPGVGLAQLALYALGECEDAAEGDEPFGPAVERGRGGHRRAPPPQEKLHRRDGLGPHQAIAHEGERSAVG